MTTTETQRLRPSAKGVVVSEGRVLVTANTTDGRVWHGLPGGGQRPGETLPDALRREVAEETGCLVEPVRLLWVRELIVALRRDLPFDREDHAIELMFESRLIDEGDGPSRPDEYQHDFAWISPAELTNVTFYPNALMVPLLDFIEGRDPGPAYLGDVD